MADSQFKELKTKSDATIEHFRKELGRMRTGRASTGLLEGLTVDYYGSQVPLMQLGLISTPEARLVTVQVYDSGAVESVDKAIRQSDLGLNPSIEGNLLRINIPALTEERRKDLVKSLHKLAEESKIALRNHRRDMIDILKKQEKAKEISNDDLHRGQDDIQKITDQYIKDIEELLEQKEKEMMEV